MANTPSIGPTSGNPRFSIHVWPSMPCCAAYTRLRRWCLNNDRVPVAGLELTNGARVGGVYSNDAFPYRYGFYRITRRGTKLTPCSPSVPLELACSCCQVICSLMMDMKYFTLLSCGPDHEMIKEHWNVARHDECKDEKDDLVR